MSDLVTVAEGSLLARDQAEQPWQNVLVLVLAGGMTREELMARIAERIEFAPRFRRVVRGRPVAGWVDDERFTLAGHVDEVTVEPGQLLQDLLQEWLARPLSRNHPLWQVTMVHGLSGGAQAVVIRINPAVVDGYDHIHLVQELLEDQPAVNDPEAPLPWEPKDTAAPEFGALWAGVVDPFAAAQRAVGGAFGLIENRIRTVTAAPRKQYVTGVEVSLTAIKRVQARYQCTTHDVLLALATAGIRGWLSENGRPIADPLTLVPLAITEPDVLSSAIGCRIAPSFDRLPVSVNNSTERLQAIATLTAARRDSGVSVSARDLVDLIGFAPATLMAVAAGSVAAGRPHSAVVVDVPGPRTAKYLGASKVIGVYGATSLTDQEDLSLTIMSYRGKVSFTVVSAEPAHDWAACITEELTVWGSEA